MMQTKLSQKLGQRLALTPQLTQSLKVLAMNCMDLENYLDETIECNPMLEMDPNARASSELENQGRTLEMPEREQWKESGDNRWETMYAQSSRDACRTRSSSGRVNRVWANPCMNRWIASPCRRVIIRWLMH